MPNLHTTEEKPGIASPTREMRIDGHANLQAHAALGDSTTEESTVSLEEHPDELRSLGRTAQERVAEHYSWDSVAAEHDRYFRELARVHGLGRHEDSARS